MIRHDDGNLDETIRAFLRQRAADTLAIRGAAEMSAAIAVDLRRHGRAGERVSPGRLAWVAILAAVVLLAAAVSLVGRDRPAIPPPSVAPTPSPVATAAAARRGDDFAALRPGRWIMRGATSGAFPAGWPDRLVIATLPGGWTHNSGARGAGIDQRGTPEASIKFGALGSVFAPDACPQPPAPGPAVADIVGMLREQPGARVEVVSLDGFPGERVAWTIPEGAPDCRYLVGWGTEPTRSETWTY